MIISEHRDYYHPTSSFNDGKCDRLGRLLDWYNGYKEELGQLNPHIGSLYSYSGGAHSTQHRTKLTSEHYDTRRTKCAL